MKEITIDLDRDRSKLIASAQNKAIGEISAYDLKGSTQQINKAHRITVRQGNAVRILKKRFP